MPKKKPARKWDNGVRPTVSGRWEWQIMNGYRADGTPHIIHGTEDTESEARKQRELARGLSANYSPHTTIAEWGDAWYVERAKQVKVTGENADAINEREGRYLEESSYVGDGFTIKWIKLIFPHDELGFTSTDRIETGISSFFKSDGSRYSPSAYSKIRSMLDQLYNRAEVKKIITHDQNPMYLMQDMHDTRKKQPQTDAYETWEVQAILSWIERHDHAMNDTARRWAYALGVGIVAGYRSQEAVPLEPADIEPDGSAIQISKAHKRGERGRPYKGDPKSAAGTRMIELPARVWRYARWLREHAVNGYVFFSPKLYARSVTLNLKGDDFIAWVLPCTYAYNITNVLKKIPGVRQLKPHQAQRHTGVTLENDAGVDQRVGMSQSGHSDAKVYRGYDHVHRGAKKQAAEKVNQLLKDKPEGSSDYQI